MDETIRLRCDRPDCQAVFEADPEDSPVRCSSCGMKQDVDEARAVDEDVAQTAESTASTTITPGEGVSITITITVDIPGAGAGGKG